MEYIIICLVIIIIFLGMHLYLLQKELNSITKKIDIVKKNDSNNIIHNNYGKKELNNLINEINSLLLEIKDTKIIYSNKNRNLTKMITNISHDLRTPLTSALGYIDIILSSNISEKEKQKELRIVEKKLKKLEELVNSFFEFSKIESENFSLELENINLVAVLENSIAGFYEDFIKENRKIDYHINNNKITMLSNKKMLTRIFDNLIANTLKHSNSDLKIFVNDSKNNVQILFENEIIDQDLDINKMFDEFYTADISRTKGDTGLGLAIAKEFTNKLGGNIYAEKNNKGLKITINFNVNLDNKTT